MIVTIILVVEERAMSAEIFLNISAIRDKRGVHCMCCFRQPLLVNGKLCTKLYLVYNLNQSG